MKTESTVVISSVISPRNKPILPFSLSPTFIFPEISFPLKSFWLLQVVQKSWTSFHRLTPNTFQNISFQTIKPFSRYSFPKFLAELTNGMFFRGRPLVYFRLRTFSVFLWFKFILTPQADFTRKIRGVKIYWPQMCPLVTLWRRNSSPPLLRTFVHFSILGRDITSFFR